MKQATVITTTNYDSLRLILTLKSGNRKQTQAGNCIRQTLLFYQGLVYQLNKEDEFDKTWYQEEIQEEKSEDEFDNEEENAGDNYEEDYEFDYHRHK